ncbi:hypothetical protein [Salinicola tamaricis]|uniref:hypothetical protein n=1 Tax=Salinicola tamaricis TaxID=1771309 RepID=UPI000D0A0A9D|nr:hypothetical protein [Salinicola tamaricis]
MTPAPTPAPPLPPDETLPVTLGERHWLDCLDAIADDDQLRPWLAQARFRQRLIARLRARHRLPAAAELPPLAPADRRLSRLDATALATCARAAGVIVHADAFASAIEAPRVSALRARFGDALHRLALQQRNQPRPEPQSAPSAGDLETLAAAVERDGWRCIGAWYHAQPRGWQAWLALAWDTTPAAAFTNTTDGADALPPAAQRDAASATARRAAAALVADTDATADEERP